MMMWIPKHVCEFCHEHWPGMFLFIKVIIIFFLPVLVILDSHAFPIGLY